MNSFVTHHHAHPAPPPPALAKHDRRAHPRAAVSFPLEFGVLPWFRHWLLHPLYRTIRSIDRNPIGSLAIPDPEPWAQPYVAAARYLGTRLFVNGMRCWEGEGQALSACGLDLSQGGLRLSTTYPLWVGASLHLRVPASTMTPFGYTLLGQAVRVTQIDRQEVEAGVLFTGIHPTDRHELARFLVIPLPQLAALRQQAGRRPQPEKGESAGIAAP